MNGSDRPSRRPTIGRIGNAMPPATPASNVPEASARARLPPSSPRLVSVIWGRGYLRCSEAVCPSRRPPVSPIATTAIESVDRRSLVGRGGEARIEHLGRSLRETTARGASGGGGGTSRPASRAWSGASMYGSLPVSSRYATTPNENTSTAGVSSRAVGELGCDVERRPPDVPRARELRRAPPLPRRAPRGARARRRRVLRSHGSRGLADRVCTVAAIARSVADSGASSSHRLMPKSVIFTSGRAVSSSRAGCCWA